MADHNHRNFTYLSDSHKGNALRKHLPDLQSQLTEDGLSTLLMHLLANNVVTPLEKEGVEHCVKHKVVQDVINDFVTQFLLRKFECDFSKIVNAIKRAGLQELAVKLQNDAKLPLGTIYHNKIIRCFT